MIKQLKPEEILDMTINNKSKRLPKIEEIKTFIKSFDSIMFRNEYTKHSYYILTDDFINKTVKYIKENNINNIVEIGCGSGLLSYWLNKYLINNNLNINIVSIDKRDESFRKAFKKSYFPILEEDGIEYIKNNKTMEKTFYISSWPNYDTDFAFDILNN
jgi:16S rRNA A1518/A1519 N6-dimethyltransferase RsmA/KsgA/DIM1 with predicted DNA glycosylase/AP lyase activity